MKNLVHSSNPYTIDEAVSDPVMFYGRSEVLTWIKEMLTQAGSADPLILYGPPGVGKSSILKKLESGYLGEQTVVIHFNIEHLPLENASSFFWAIASTINRLTVEQEVDILTPLVDKKEFAADPATAFKQFLAIVTKKQMNGRDLLLTFDDLDILAGQSQPGYVEHEILTGLKDVLQQTNNLAYIFTLNGPVDTLPPDALAPFNLSRRYLVANFDLETTLTFLRQSSLFNTSSLVTNYIYTLTAGHPGDIQRYCYELYQRRRDNKLLHITLADVVAVTRQSKGNNGFTTPVFSRLSESPATVLMSSGSKQLAAPEPLPAIWSKSQRSINRLWPIFALLLIILVAGGGYLIATNQQDPAPILAADIQTNTPEPTELAPTAVPTQPLPTRTIRPTTAVENPTATAETPTLEPTAVPSTPTPTMTQTPEPSPLPVSVEFPPEIIRESDQMLMLIVPGGTFIMGGSEDDPSVGFDETPEHDVTVSTFYMDKFEVTVAQYADFLNTIGTYSEACDGVDCAWPREFIGYTSYLLETGEDDDIHYEAMEGFENYPINHVSWYGADAYCQEMDARLPTEAEWEYAARGEDGRIYPWGNQRPDSTRAIYFSQNYEDLKPVDALPDGASPFGIYGMAGSMWEWVSDWYDPNYYSESPSDNPQGPESGLGKVSRGGAWPNNNQADRIRASNRNWREAAFFSPDLGFRCAYTP